MTISKFVESLSAELSPGASVLTDSASDEFKAAHERWTELELKTPGAIVLASTEEDIVQAVRFRLHIICQYSDSLGQIGSQIQHPFCTQVRRT
jgi:hypothetical protein